MITLTKAHNPNDPIAIAMQAALVAARHFQGATSPNPPVGCALLNSQGAIIITAAHAGAGQDHAEALAIKQAKSKGQFDEINTVVVTLEPCNHHGRTPPCTEAILASPAKNVVIGIADPNPHVAGGGAARLIEAGLNVRFFSGETQQLNRLIGPFRKRIMQGLPWLTIKQAVNKYGTMIPSAGQKTFTSPSSLELAHALRRRADAIFTGSGTVLADNPHFTVRLIPDHPNKLRKLVLFDRQKRIPQDYFLAAEQRGFTPMRADNLEVELRNIANAGGLEVLVEAGPQFTRFVQDSNFWDEHVCIRQTNAEDHIEIITNGGGDVLRHN